MWCLNQSFAFLPQYRFIIPYLSIQDKTLKTWFIAFECTYIGLITAICKTQHFTSSHRQRSYCDKEQKKTSQHLKPIYDDLEKVALIKKPSHLITKNFNTFIVFNGVTWREIRHPTLMFIEMQAWIVNFTRGMNCMHCYTFFNCVYVLRFNLQGNVRWGVRLSRTDRICSQ